MGDIEEMIAEGGLENNLSAAQNRDFVQIQGLVQRKLFDETCDVVGIYALLLGGAARKRLLRF